MNKFFFDNFDTDAAGALPAWFTVISGTWEVVDNSSQSYSTPNSLQNTSYGDGQKVLLTGSGVTIPATADIYLSYVAPLYDGVNRGIQPIIRSDSAGQNYYVCLIYDDGSDVGAVLYKCVSGSLSQIGSQVSTGIAFASGEPLFVNFNCVGSTIGLRVWYTGGDPGSNQVTWSDSSITAAGYAGFYYASNSGASNFSIDNMQVSGNSSLAAGTISTTGTTASSISLSSTAATGGTGPYTYQWYRSTTSGFIPDTATELSAATSLTLTDTGLTASTTYYYTLVATDSTSAIVWSGQYSQETSAGYATDFTLAPSDLTTYPGVATGSYAVTLASAPASSTTISLSASASGGTFAPSSLTFIAGGSQTFTYTPSSSASAGSITLTTQASGGITTNHTTTCTVASAASAGTVYATYVGAKTVQLSGSFPTGGSGSFTFQWYRSTTSGSLGSAIGGATAESLIDTGLTPATNYYYTLVYQDTAGGSPVGSAQAGVTTLASSAYEIVGGLGDSIMAGSYSTVETPFAAMIDQLNFGFTSREWYGGTSMTGTSGGLNLSLNQSVSGTKTTDWLPTGSYLPSAVSTWSSAGVTRIIINVGANDAQKSIETSVATYKSNLSTIISYLFANISSLKSVHLVSPMFQGETSGNYGVQNCGLLIGYGQAMSQLANGTTIFNGGAEGPYNYMQRRDGSIQRSADLLHPNDEGDQATGGMWANSILLALTTAAPGGLRRISMSNGGFVQ